MERIAQSAPGVPAYQRDSGFSDIELLIGDLPPNGVPQDVPVAASATFALYSVVGISGGVLALAKQDASVKALGVLMVPVATGVGQTGSARIHRSGHFNMNKLVWDASFTTEAQKVAAFEGAASPTTILIGKNPYDPVFS